MTDETEMLTEYLARAKNEDLQVTAVDHAKEPVADAHSLWVGKA